MSERVEMLSGFYGQFDEDARLKTSRHGQLEYSTTMEYIHRFLKTGDRVLEIGAGTGRYSLALAKEGYDVTAVELVESNLDVLRSHITGDMQIDARQGDALDLSEIADDSFDITVSLGPLYHLYEKEDIQKAIDEAVRVTKKDGIVIFAFISVYAIIASNFLYGDLSLGLDMNFSDDYSVKHFRNQLFTGYDICEFEQLFKGDKTEYITTAACDGIIESVESRSDFLMSDEDFEKYFRYHLATCEKRELLGCSSHLLYICKVK